MLAYKILFYYVVLKYKSTVPQMSFVTRLRTFLLSLKGEYSDATGTKQSKMFTEATKTLLRH